MHTSVLHVGVCEESGAELVAWSRTLRAIRFLRFVRVLRWLKLKGVTETFKDPSESTLLFATRVASCSRLPVVYIDGKAPNTILSSLPPLVWHSAPNAHISRSTSDRKRSSFVPTSPSSTTASPAPASGS